MAEVNPAKSAKRIPNLCAPLYARMVEVLKKKPFLFFRTYADNFILDFFLAKRDETSAENLFSRIYGKGWVWVRRRHAGEGRRGIHRGRYLLSTRWIRGGDGGRWPQLDFR